MDLLIELALARENNFHLEKFLKSHLSKGVSPTPDRGESRGSKTPTKPNKGGGNGSITYAMNEVKLEAGVPELLYCKPVNDKGEPFHAPHCDHCSRCMLQQKG